MNTVRDSRISSPLRLQIRTARRHGQIMSVREHLPSYPNNDPALPLVVITYHPGFAAGSYEDRDYFELLTSLLFNHCQGCYRLRIFTINHPGYDLPGNHKVNRFKMDKYSIRRQPAIIDQVLRWLLLRYFAAEDDLFLLAYGHSMGGLALAQSDLEPLLTAVNRQGRRLRMQKVLSAPAFILHENARSYLNQLNALKAVKHTLGRMPLYESITQGLFRSLAPLFYRRDAAKYALNPDCSFVDFSRYNPFVLLEQGLELIKLDFNLDHMAGMLDGSHLILCNDDGMVDTPAMLHAANHANDNGASVHVHAIDSSHNPERDDPQLITDAVCSIMRPLISGSTQPAFQPVFMAG